MKNCSQREGKGGWCRGRPRSAETLLCPSPPSAVLHTKSHRSENTTVNRTKSIPLNPSPSNREGGACSKGNVIPGTALQSRREEVGGRDGQVPESHYGGVQKQRRTLCVRPTWCQAQHSADPAKTPVSPALAHDPRHGDGPRGDQGDRPTSGNAHVASGASPQTPCCPRGALLGGTWGSVLLSPWEGRSGGPRDLRT